MGMRTAQLVLLLVLLLLLDPTRAADPANEWQGKKVPSLILADGKTYSDVTFTKVEADAVTITHAGGILRIPMEALKPEAQQALGYDPDKAAAARKRYLATKAAPDAANARRVPAEQVEMAEKAAAEELEAATYRIALRIVQVVDDGALAKITVLNSGGGGVEGDALEFIEFDPGKHNVVDGEYVEATAIAMAEPYRYTDVQGAQRTVRKWLLVE